MAPADPCELICRQGARARRRQNSNAGIGPGCVKSRPAPPAAASTARDRATQGRRRRRRGRGGASTAARRASAPAAFQDSPPVSAGSNGENGRARPGRRPRPAAATLSIAWWRPVLVVGTAPFGRVEVMRGCPPSARPSAPWRRSLLRWVPGVAWFTPPPHLLQHRLQGLRIAAWVWARPGRPERQVPNRRLPMPPAGQGAILAKKAPRIPDTGMGCIGLLYGLHWACIRDITCAVAAHLFFGKAACQAMNCARAACETREASAYLCWVRGRAARPVNETSWDGAVGSRDSRQLPAAAVSSPKSVIWEKKQQNKSTEQSSANRPAAWPVRVGLLDEKAMRMRLLAT